MARTALTALVFALGLGFFAAAPNTAAAADVKTYVVPANSTDTLSTNLVGGENKVIALSGDGDTCLELRVYDPLGNLVASDTAGLGDDRVVKFRTGFGGKYTIKVRNIGNVSNKYMIGIK